jgi:hypothetical protein
MGTLHEDQRICTVLSRWFLLGMRNVSDKIYTENQNVYFTFNNFFFRKLCHLRDNVKKVSARQAKDDNIIWHMYFAWWITKATNTHSECIILIPFPQQQWVYIRAWILCHTYTTVLLIPFIRTTCHHSCSYILANDSWLSFIMKGIQWLLLSALLLREELLLHVYIHSSKIFQITHILTYFA